VHSETDPDCVGFGAAHSAEDVLAFVPPADGVYCFSTEGSRFDTVLYVRADACEDVAAEIACNDVGDFSAGLQSSLDVPLQADATYYVFIDGADADSDGPYVLTVSDGPCEAAP